MTSLPRFALVGAAVVALSAGCGEPLPPPEPLEALAAACPEAPGLQLADVPGVVGLNAYYLQEEATRALRRGEAASDVLEETLAKAARMGVRVLRTGAYNDGADKVGDSALQVAPLVYDETALRGLDLVLARARAHGIRLVLPLGNYWDAYGGARRYVAWAGLKEPREGDPRFFTERRVVEHYKAHVRNLLQRINTVDGERYGEHPAVLAWELLNEPRGDGLDARGHSFRAWVDELGAHVKALAPGHLVGTGEEGYDHDEDGYDAGFWRREAGGVLFRGGISFRLNTASRFIDYASVHVYPVVWADWAEAAARTGARWISEHAAVARELGKPLLVGEFGLPDDGTFLLEERRALYRGWFRCARRTGVAGMLPWMFANDARPREWDPYSFSWQDGTTADDPVNQYVHLVEEAALRP
ncbi:MAG: cellulase family glycosylhydrolase [Myxococcaceae bacterium]|nr:cellulase family glycosylhydrolase [Myxococcaceae bacterium]MCI0671081.1 cellulase family glycosylhydrolase [Myxococcaceae bacterium]